jgi:hypothetical protein
MKMKPISPTPLVLLALLAAGTLTVGIARSEPAPEDAAAVQALSQVKITLADAIRAVEAAGKGVVVGAELDVSKDGIWYDITTQTGKDETDHRVDPMTGVIGAGTPDHDTDADGDSDGDETTEVTAIQSSPMTLLQALAVSDGQGARALGVEYGMDEGKLGIELVFADASGEVQELMIDTATGVATPAENDNE